MIKMLTSLAVQTKTESDKIKLEDKGPTDHGP